VDIEVRLFATLREYLPAGSSRTSARLEMPSGASIGDVLDRLGIPREAAHLVLVNGLHEADLQRVLEGGLVLSIWPPVAGG
jgi:molybdopterin converting factor small subunit